MTLSLPNRIASATGLLEALRIIGEEPESSGLLEISSGSYRGKLWFAKGQIIDAEVCNSGDRGQTALVQLVTLPVDSTVTFVEGAEAPVPSDLEMSVETFLSQIANRTTESEWAKMPKGPSTIHTHNGPDAKQRYTDALERAFVDEKHFEHVDAKLEWEPTLTDAEKEHLTSGPELKFDDKPFEHVEVSLRWGHGLTEEQKAALEGAQKSGEAIGTFDQLHDFLQHKGLHLTPEQEKELKATETARSKNEQIEEFHQPAGWEHTEPIEMKPLLEEEIVGKVEEPVDQGDPDTLKKLEVYDIDYEPLKLMAEKPSLPKRQDLGIITRIGEFVNARWKPSGKRRKVRMPMSAETVLAIVCLSIMFVCIFVLPEVIKYSSGADAEQRAKARLQRTIRRNLAENPQEAAELKSRQGGRSASGPVNSTPPPNGSEGKSSYESQDLSEARTLVASGNYTAAVTHYEYYIKLDPDNIPARIELINAYLATKQRSKARLLCIQTLKKNLSSAEVASVWQLFAQCQTD